MGQWKPQNYTSLSPYLVVNKADRLVEFCKTVFNATVLRDYRMPDGTIMHIELKIDDSVLMLGEASEQFPAFTSLLHLYVKNVDEVFDKAISLGATLVDRPKTKDGDPDKRGSFKDMCGNTWAVAPSVRIVVAPEI